MHEESARSGATKEHAVVIAGGGSTGLMLAAELALARVDVAIVERRASQHLAGTRARGLHSRTIEVLDQRGIADRFLSQGQVAQIAGLALIPLDISDFPTRYNYGLALLQKRIEHILAAWVGELAVPIYRARDVTGFAQDDTGVDVELSDGTSLRTKYLVGCDGGRSLIRKKAGIDFPGWDPSTSYLLAEVELSEEADWGLRRDEKGMRSLSKLEDGKRVGVLLEQPPSTRSDEPTLSDLRSALIAAYGTDYGAHDPVWITTFTDMTRQAASYRERRVLLAGDAAHVHSPTGGQGLNIGVQDAVNLGWKLAQVVSGQSPESLLDTYHAERHPIGARVLKSTMAATALSRGDERTKALRETLSDLLELDPPRKQYAGMLSGLDVHYDLGPGHPLLGRRMPDLDLATESGPRRVFTLLHAARPVLLNLGEPGALDIAPWADRVQRVDARYAGVWELPVLGAVAPPAAVLIRPDGYVAWVGEGTDGGLRDALTTWFGPPIANALPPAGAATHPPTTLTGDGSARITRYRNPVLPGFHPDPSVVRVGKWFYLVNSSFAFFPGVPIYRSRDLVHWEPIGHVLARDSQVSLATAESWAGIWAPTLRYHAGVYYMITTNMSHGGTFFVTAENPAGPWSEPVWIPGIDGIDPSLFFDDDGKVYLTATGTPSGIYAAQIAVESGRLLTAPRLVWAGTGGRYPEGPHLYKIAAHYYLLISEGGTEYGHMVTVARARSPWGPFEPCPRNPILTHRDRTNDEPIQGTGHPDLVEDAEGHWWMVLLAFRPQGGPWHHLGRETFLAPVRWDAQGWPVVNEGRAIALDTQVNGLPAHPPAAAASARDDFDAPLGPAWNFLRNPVRESYSIVERPGWLTLRGTPVSLDCDKGASPTFVGRRQEHVRVRTSAFIDFSPVGGGEEAGLVIYGGPRHHYDLGVSLGKNGREIHLRQTVGKFISTVTRTMPASGKDGLILRIDAEPTRYSFSWGHSVDRMTSIGDAETRFLSSEVAGGFIGTYIGMYALAPTDDPGRAFAAFDWFDYEPQE